MDPELPVLAVGQHQTHHHKCVILIGPKKTNLPTLAQSEIHLTTQGGNGSSHHLTTDKASGFDHQKFVSRVHPGCASEAPGKMHMGDPLQTSVGAIEAGPLDSRGTERGGTAPAPPQVPCEVLVPLTLLFRSLACL